MAERINKSYAIYNELIEALVRAGLYESNRKNSFLNILSGKRCFYLNSEESRISAVIEIIFGREEYAAKQGTDFSASDRLLAQKMIQYQKENPEISIDDLVKKFSPIAEHKFSGAYATDDEIEKMSLKESERARKYSNSVHRRIYDAYRMEKKIFDAIDPVPDSVKNLIDLILTDRESLINEGHDMDSLMRQSDLFLVAWWLKRYKVDLIRVLEKL